MTAPQCAAQMFDFFVKSAHRLALTFRLPKMSRAPGLPALGVMTYIPHTACVPPGNRVPHGLVSKFCCNVPQPRQDQELVPV